ncbi:hypothetical protein D3C80_1500960 [compost metagenome]
MACIASRMGLNATPEKTCASGSRIWVFQLARRLWSCSCGNSVATSASQPAHWPRTFAISSCACWTRSSSSSAEGISPASSCLPSGRLPAAKKSSNASQSLILLRRLSSMLMRSMPSVYSAMRGRGITTSSLILNALVWREIAAVRLRSSQNFLRASALTAVKPSPLRELAMRTTSAATRATSSALSPAMSPSSTILGRWPLHFLLLVA